MMKKKKIVTKKYFLTGLYWGTLYKINDLLSPRQRERAIFVFFTTFLNGLLDVMGLAIILPVLYLINDPTKIHSNNYLNDFFIFFNFSSDRYFLLFISVLLVFSFILKNVLGLYLIYIQEKFVGDLASDIIEREFSNKLHRSYIEHIGNNSSKTIQEFTRIPTEFARLVVSSILLVSTEYFVILLVLSFIVWYNPALFVLLAISLVPTIFVLTKLTRKKISEFGDLRNKTQTKIFRQATEAMHSFIDIKITRNNTYFIEKLKEQLKTQEHVMTWLKTLNSIPFRTVETASVLAIGILYVYVAFFTNDPKQMLTILVLFASASYRILPSLNRILSSLMIIRSSQYVFDTINHYSEALNNDTPINKTRLEFKKDILVKNVNYSYPEKEDKSLDGVCLTIKKGAAIGLMGESGSGKSTLGKLLLGLLTPQEGCIEIDGTPLCSENMETWNNMLGYVPQDFYLLDATLAENIAFGIKPESINYEKISKIIEQVQLKDLVDRLKDGVLTYIGEFGNKLSGGQRQRIAIARALYRDVQILVFDEATSALDNNTEKEIMKTLYNLQNNNLTLIIIAHRLTSLEKCDLIYRMSKGKVVEKYSYYELVAKDFL